MVNQLLYKRLATVLSMLQAERDAILARPFTARESQRLEAIDELSDTIWGFLAVDAVEGDERVPA